MTDAALALTAGEVAEAAGGEVVRGDPAARFVAFGIDSRTVVPGQLFFAIVGARHDGHVFVDEATRKGAGGLVVQPDRTGASAGARGGSMVVIRVEDTTRALQQAARAMRRRSGARVIAITGSAGKTTTKEVTAAFLELRYRTFRNKGNFNNHIGLPLSLLELGRAAEAPQMAVLELGMSAPGEIRTLVGLAEPEVRVWTNVAEAHLEHFASIEGIADAKAEILEGASADALLVANAADPRVMRRAPRFAGRTLTFAVEEAADVSARQVESRGIRGMAADVTTPAGRARIETPLVGRGNLANLLAALAVGLDAGVPLDSLADRARTLAPASHRGEVRQTALGVTVIDDAYNANPLAVERTLEVLAAESGFPRRIAILGEMLELGDTSADLHARCGRAAARAGLDLLVTVGGRPARALGEAAVAAGMPAPTVIHAETADEAAAIVLPRLRERDLVLVKGSRGIRLEQVVDRLDGARG